MPFGRRRARGSWSRSRTAAGGGRPACRSRRSSGRSRRRSSTSRSGSPTTTARRRPARSRSSRPELPKRRKEQAPPAERQSFGGEAEPAELLPEQRAAIDRIVAAIDAGAGGAVPALRADRLREDRGVPPGLRGSARARARRDPARAGDLARAADRRPGARAVRRPGRDPPLRAHRRGAARRARADRERRGADRRRRALGGLRAGARARADRGRRGARRLVQAGLRPALRRAHARRQARRARGGGRRLRLGDAAARELGGARAARARAAGSAASCRRCRSSTCAARRATRSRRRCSPSCGGWRERRGKAILLLNRRGIAPALHCRACGRHDPLPELRRRARPAPRRRAALPPLRPPRAGARDVPDVRLVRARAARRGHAVARARARAASSPSSS